MKTLVNPTLYIDKTESPMFVLLCVLVSKVKLLEFYNDHIGKKNKDIGYTLELLRRGGYN